MFKILTAGSDFIAGILLFFIDLGILNPFKTFFAIFLLFKGTSTFINLPVWFGPLFYFAGIVDSIVGISLYFFYSNLLLIKIIGLILLIKGLLTIYPLIWSLIPLFNSILSGIRRIYTRFRR